MKVRLTDGQSYEVYKVQRAMFSSDGTTSYLIYNEARDEQLETEDPKICRALYTLCPKSRYFIAGRLEEGKMNFKEVLKGDVWF